MKREDSPPAFEYLGYFEEVWDATTRECLGTRRCAEQPGRAVGEAGDLYSVLKSPMDLNNGYKTKVIKASVRRPRKIFTRLQILCGRAIRKG